MADEKQRSCATEGVTSLETPAVRYAELTNGEETSWKEKMDGVRGKQAALWERSWPLSGHQSHPQPQMFCCMWQKFWNILEHELLQKKRAFRSGRSRYKPETTNSFQVQYFGFQNHKFNCKHSPWLQNGDICHNAKKSLVLNIMRYEFCSFSQETEILTLVKRAAWQSREDALVGMNTHATQQIMLQKGRPRLRPLFPRVVPLWISTPTSFGAWAGRGLRHFPDCVLLLDPRCRQAGRDLGQSQAPSTCFMNYSAWEASALRRGKCRDKENVQKVHKDKCL